GARWARRRCIDGIMLKNAGRSIAPDTDEKHYSGGIALDPVDPGIVYLSRKTGDAQWDLGNWKTRDGGETWSTRTIASRASVKNIRPYVPLGRPAHTEMVLWMSGTYGYWDFSQ